EHIEEKRTYFIDDVEVSLKTFNDFLSNPQNYVDQIVKKEPKALAKTNLMKWISKHFKMEAKFVDVVDDYVKHVYDLTVSDIKNKKKMLFIQT
ncbi:hypothetical protein, partial [Enterobacter hormaechei]|uniref:hypothetical protein n=1 Tax=Enterobacter hormaechei TaxID=158836 RepID=UPI00148353D1